MRRSGHYSGVGAGTFVASDVASLGSAFALHGPSVFRFVDDGTNINFWISQGGFCWVSLGSWARAGYLTPSEFGIIANGVDGAGIYAYHYFRVTQP
jgi:hypothetical protein